MNLSRILVGDAIEQLRTIESDSIDCCVTSPPYFGLRDYGHEGQIGLEKTPQEFVAKMVEVFREVRRVLKPSGTCWVNLGDSYAANGTKAHQPQTNTTTVGGVRVRMPRGATPSDSRADVLGSFSSGLKPKDLCMIPARVAIALQDDGWYLRQDVIWSKPNPMPESVTDRCTKAHEYVFLLTKSAKYFYDAKAVAETAVKGASGSTTLERVELETRNRRSVWTIATQPYKEAHFATFPEELARTCILAGCPEGGTVLDCFAGSGTALAVAAKIGRQYVGIELNEAYVELIRRRLSAITPPLDLFRDRSRLPLPTHVQHGAEK